MHVIRKQVIALLIGAATITGAMIPAAAQAAPAAPVSTSGEMAVQSVGIDVFTKSLDITNKIIKVVQDAIEHGQNRDGYVKSLMEGAFYDARQQYNVMVINTGNRYSANLQNVVYEANVHGSGYPSFRVIVFSSGTFTNQGDGGYGNWAFRGWFTRDGMTVNFRRP
ncbi:hypothetical protein ACWEIJ_11050 [Lentzea sp. NPDC004789]